jgi:PAS domain S-box-containing protein
MPILFILVAMLFAGGLPIGICNASPESREVRVGSELEFPPYAFVDESGQPAGFSVELIKAVANVMGLQIKISTGPWDTVWNALVAGQLDVLPIVAKLPERQPLVDFSIPHTETYDAFFVRKGTPLIQNIEGAKRKEIAVMRSDAAHHALLARNFEGRLILVDTIPEGLSLISSGKHDAFLCSKLIGTMSIMKHGLKGLTPGPPIPDYKRVFSFAVKKGDVELLEKLNQGLLIIKTNKDYDRIYEKWLTSDDPWRKWEKYFFPAAAAVIAIALIVGFWLVMLQLLVKKRTRELAERNEMLRLAQEGLEERVAERTTQLTNANAALHSEINERKQAEEELRKSEARHRSYIEVTEQLGWTTDANGEVVEDIPSWRGFTGQGEKEVKGWGWSKALHPDDLEHTARVWRNAVATRNSYETEYRIRRQDGSYRHFLARGVPVFKDNGDIREWVGTCIDITERKRTEEALKQYTKELQRLTETLEQRVRERTEELEKANEGLRRLSSKLLSAQEEERKRIAGEIHDTLGSCLNAIKFKIEDTLLQIGGTPRAAAESLSTVIPMIHEGVEECRRIQMDLRPAMLDDLGLLPTLSWFFRKFQAIYSQIQIAQEIEVEDKDIPPSLKIVIFRVTQEAMNNIAKYSKADLARLSLRKLDNRMELAIQDNGQGFNPGKVTGSESGRRGLGLTSMRERVELSGGSFYIESFEGNGTTIRAAWSQDESG